MSEQDSLIDILADADETYANIPQEVMLQIEELAKRLPEFGPRMMRSKGPGSQYYDARPFRPGLDDPRLKNHKMSARRDEDIFTEMQAENRQPVFFWRKGTGTTATKYSHVRPTKKEFLEVAFLASAKAIAAKEDMVGVLDNQGLYRGTAGADNIATHFFNANVITGSAPLIGQTLPFGSTVVLGSDFLADADEQEDLVNAISQLSSMGLNGRICMVLDPLEMDFNEFEGHIRFTNPESGREYISEKAESLRHEFNEKMNNYVDWIQNLAHSNGFKFILHRTDEAPIDLVLKIFDDPTVAPGMAPTF